jgi:hypothetical protein
MRRVCFILTLCLALFATACVNQLHPYNTPSQQKLRVQSPSPERYMVRVADIHDYPLSSDGHVTFDVPQLPRGCTVRLFGLVKVRDTRSEDVRAIHVMRDGAVVRRLSLTDIARLPVDSAGYHIVDLK